MVRAEVERSDGGRDQRGIDGLHVAEVRWEQNTE